MNLNEAATLLGWSREQVRDALKLGVRPPGDVQPLILHATARGADFEIEDGDLDRFIKAFEIVEPGRHPPVGIRRQLRQDAREMCCVCGSEGPFEYHHILDWAKLKHHDHQHMMLLCRNCHGKCTVGEIDHPRQRFYKSNPHWRASLFAPSVPDIQITWNDLRSVVTILHDNIKIGPATDPGHDYKYVGIEEKNQLNRLSADYFATWHREYEPRFRMIEEFLGDGRNDDLREQYYEIVGDIRTAIATLQGKQPEIAFDEVLNLVFEAAFAAFSTGTKVNREALRTVVAFMYFECDIGRKSQCSAPANT